MQAENDVVTGARFGDVEVETTCPHGAMGDAVDVRWTVHPGQPRCIGAHGDRLRAGGAPVTRPPVRQRSAAAAV